MDDLISLFRKSLKELGVSPVLLAAGFVVGLLSLATLAGYALVDDTVKAITANFSQLLLPLVIMPFITGGALGYAVEIRQKGSSSPATFLDAAMKNYVKMLLGGIISFALFYILITGVMVFLLAGGMVDLFLGSILGLAMLVLTFLCLMAIEFYDISIVAEGSGVMAAFRKSFDFVRRNLPAAIGFFVIVVVFKCLVQMPLSFGLAGAMMSNATYFNALMGANGSLNSSVNSSINSTINATSLLTMSPVTLGVGSLLTVGAFQVLLQAFIFALLTLFKAEFYLNTGKKKKITDFDYDFSDEAEK